MKQENIGYETPDIGKLLEGFGNALSRQFNCHKLGKITGFNTQTLTCTVRLLEKLFYMGQAENYVEFSDMPLLIQGTDNAHLTFGNIVGSECLIHFNDTDIDNWFITGEIYKPNSRRKHDVNDGFVELRPFSNVKVFEYDSGGTVLQNKNCKLRLLDDGSVEITNGTALLKMNGNTVTITGNVVVNGKVNATDTIKSDVDVISNVISGNSHTHTFTQAPSGQGETNPPQ